MSGRYGMVSLISMVAILLAVQVEVTGAAGSPRIEKHIYNGSRGDSSGAHETNLQEMTFSSRRGEKWIVVEVDDHYRDDAGVLAQVEQDVDGDGQPDYSYDVCGRTDKPLRIRGGPDILVRIELVDGCQGLIGATSGEVTIVYFRNKRAAVRHLQLPPASVERSARDDDANYIWGGGVAAGPLALPPIALLDSPDGSSTIGGARFDTTAAERFISVKIADDSGLPVRAALYTGPHGTGQFVADVCGFTKDSVELPSGTEQVIVYVLQGPCADATPAAATRGTVFATLSNLP